MVLQIEDLVLALERAVDCADATGEPMPLQLISRISQLNDRMQQLNDRCVRMTNISDDASAKQPGKAQARRSRGTSDSSDDDGAPVARTYDAVFHLRGPEEPKPAVLRWLSRQAQSFFTPRQAIDRVSDEAVVPALLRAMADSDLRQVIANHHDSLSFGEVADYYESRPELSLYTLTTELTRMEYVVVDESGHELSDPLVIRKCYHETPTACAGCELLWRMANQSLLDFLVRPLYGHWLSPDMESSMSVSSCAMQIDLRARCLRCECKIVVACEHEGSRLAVATCGGAIDVDLSQRTVAASLGEPSFLVNQHGEPVAGGREEG